MAALLDGLAAPEGRTIAYREEIHHPALLIPEETRGTMALGPDGTLVRDQTWPGREITEIGARVLRVRSGPEAEPNLLPIPDALQPMLRAIRGLVGGDASGLAEGFAVTLLDPGPPWRIALGASSPALPATPSLEASGCGPLLRMLEVTTADGLRRVLHFGQPR